VYECCLPRVLLIVSVITDDIYVTGILLLHFQTRTANFASKTFTGSIVDQDTPGLTPGRKMNTIC
jgi:hypothetical protein